MLVHEDLVVETGVGPSAGGKPPTLLGLNAGARSVISVDLSDGTLTGSVLDLKATIADASDPQSLMARGEGGVQQLFDVLDELVEAAPAPILGIGVGTPGVVDSVGTVVEASNLGWHNIPLGDLLADRYNVPVKVLNNSRAAALAEYSFGGYDAKNLVVVKIGNGIGAGVVLDGRIHSGENDAAGEIGHVVVDPDGPACFCGKAGCLETVAAIPYLIRTLARFTDDSASLPAPDVLGRAAELAEEGNPDVLAVLNEAGRNLAKVLSTTVAILDVHQVIVTGPISRLGEPFLARLRSEIQQRILPTLAAKLELRFGRTGERAVRMGAAAYVVNDQLGVL
ncbi:MAG: ROK family protein [Acidimicrobiia bacterium]